MRLTFTRRGFGQGTAFAIALAALHRPGPAVAGDRNHLVRIHDFTFEPADLTIMAGETVMWENADLAPHTATSKTRNWDTGHIGKDAAASIVFNAPGEHHYFCAFHPHMKGLIRVLEPD